MNFEVNLRGQQATDEELLKNLIEVHAVLLNLDKKISISLYTEFGKFSITAIKSRFGSWNEALERANIPITQQKNISEDDLFKNVSEVWISNGCQPTRRDMGRVPSKFNGSTYSDRFGSWNKALLAFSEYMRSESSEINAVSTSGKIPLENVSQKTKRTNRAPSDRPRFSILLRDGFRCMSCGRSPVTTPGVELHVDHIQPWSEGGELATGQKWNHIVQHELPRPTRQQDLPQAIQPYPKHRPFRRPMILELQPLQT
jgi:Homing endonuclease associated repeat